LKKAQIYEVSDRYRRKFFLIDEKHNSLELTDKGIEGLTRKTKDLNFFGGVKIAFCFRSQNMVEF